MTTPAELESFYREYIACLNQRDWSSLYRFVHEDVRHNSRPLGLDGYRAMLESDVERIPDLRFAVQLLVAQPPFLASRLLFDVSPKGELLELPVNGRRVRFAENAFYEIREQKILEVWSVLDKLAIEAQLREPP